MSDIFRRPESVLVVVAHGGDILLLRRRDPPGYWQSVTGSLHWAESPLAAARRELREETGVFAEAGLEDTGIVNTFEIAPPWTTKFAPGTTHNTEHVYLLQLRERPEIVLHAHEHLEFRWLAAGEAAALASSASNRQAIRELFGC